MVRSYAYDVEILPNFFSVTFVDLTDYLNVFKDACNIEIKKGKEKRTPIPLTQKYKVEDIKTMLNRVKTYCFYITDTDDSQLLQMLGFINSLRPHYEGNVPVRSDCFGYNNSKYDKLMTACLLMNANHTFNTKELINKLYETSKHIISSQDNPEAKNDYTLKLLYSFKLPFTDIDVMTIFALNKCGKGVDKNGNTVYFPKSLKQTSINLQWYELLEHELPPITDKDKYYYNDIGIYKSLSCEQLNKLVDKWDRYMIDEWIPDVMHYNKNDVYIVCEMVRLYIDEIRLRYSISMAYEIDVLSSSRSNIADKMFVKFYSDFSGLQPFQWRGKKTERTKMAFKRVILPFIKFKTKELQEFLEEMKQVVVYSIGKKALKDVAHNYPNFKYLKTNLNDGWFEVTINKMVYSIATGGLHTQDIPRELKSKIEFIDAVSSTGKDMWSNMTDTSYVYVHWDIASFYPSIMSVYNVAPAHLNEGVFVKLITWLKDTRVKAKHSEEEYIDGIPKDTLAQVLKIVINSIYGKLGFEAGDICDRLAVLKVTINGQLMIMMLCEELELAGIEVVSANTDGIVVKLYKTHKEKFEEIANNWKQLTQLDADSEEYNCYINRDINNYFVQELNGKITYKGALNPYMYSTDLTKGYDMPIVAQAVVNYFLYNKPILDTLYECQNILDFCKTQNVGRQFHVEYTNSNGTEKLQRNVRFYVSNNGGVIEKVSAEMRGNLCAGHYVTVLNTLDDKRIEYRNINYSYYYQEAMKIIDPIKLRISPNLKADARRGTRSGKNAIRAKSGQYNSLFDDDE